jgi:hypothetical protein
MVAGKIPALASDLAKRFVKQPGGSKKGKKRKKGKKSFCLFCASCLFCFHLSLLAKVEIFSLSL